MKKNLSIALILLIVASVAFSIFSKREAFLQSYDASYWETRYQESNWAKGWESKKPIGDAELYTYSGWRLVQGDDPKKIA